jgi:hypothetical protein
MDTAAIQNLEYLRQLIAEIRLQESMRDEDRLRMPQGSGMGFGSVTREEV